MKQPRSKIGRPAPKAARPTSPIVSQSITPVPTPIQTKEQRAVEVPVLSWKHMSPIFDQLASAANLHEIDTDQSTGEHGPLAQSAIGLACRQLAVLGRLVPDTDCSGELESCWLSPELYLKLGLRFARLAAELSPGKLRELLLEEARRFVLHGIRCASQSLSKKLLKLQTLQGGGSSNSGQSGAREGGTK